MQAHVVLAATDFWGVVFPAYLGAAGTILAGLVSMLALVTSLRNSAGVRNIAQTINDEAANDAGGFTPQTSPPADHTFPPTPDGWAPPAEPLSTIYVADHFKYGLVNRWKQALTLTGVEILTDGVKVSFTEGMPIQVASGGIAEYDLHRGLVGPTTAQMRISWRTEDGKTGESTVLLV